MWFVLEGSSSIYKTQYDAPVCKKRTCYSSLYNRNVEIDDHKVVRICDVRIIATPRKAGE